jgi:hypothetical protein
MNTVVIKAPTKADVKFLMDFAKRIGASAKTVNTEEIEDLNLIALIEQGLKTKSVSRKEVMDALTR